MPIARRALGAAALSVLLLTSSLLLSACGGGGQGLTQAEVEEIVRAAIASTPSKAAPAEYTRFLVDSAVARYETKGLGAAMANHNSAQSIDGNGERLQGLPVFLNFLKQRQWARGGDERWRLA